MTISHATTRWITTPIFYVNSAPHLGHAYSMILADTICRTQRLLNFPLTAPAPQSQQQQPHDQNIRLMTGTDEHGQKIMQAATNKGLEPAIFCQAQSNRFRLLANSLNLTSDYQFIRTSASARHVETVQKYWNQLMAAGYIVPGQYTGWYSVDDETFYRPEQIMPLELYANERSTSESNAKDVKMVARETGKIVSLISEHNFQFRIDLLRDRLISYFNQLSDPNAAAGVVLPHSQTASFREWIKELPDRISISRPKSRISWGISVPNNGDINDNGDGNGVEEAQTVYVWFDALFNYLTVAESESEGSSFNSSSGLNTFELVHVLGKDISRFHLLLWPALLMALEKPLPLQYIVHSHFLVQGTKMSKSLGNVLDPLKLLTQGENNDNDEDPYLIALRKVLDPLGIPFKADILRYVLLRNSKLNADSGISWHLIWQLYQGDLVGEYGNLFSRLFNPKFFKSITNYNNDDVNDDSKNDGGLLTDPDCVAFWKDEIIGGSLFGTFQKHAITYRFDLLLGPDCCLGLVQGLHRFIYKMEPWKLVNQNNPKRMKQFLTVTVQACRLLLASLEPVMPHFVQFACASIEPLAIPGLDVERRALCEGNPRLISPEIGAFAIRNHGSMSKILFFPRIDDPTTTATNVVSSMKKIKSSINE